MLDRIKGAWALLARGGNPNLDYMTLYRAVIVEQLPYPNLKVTVHPEDPRLPRQMANIPLKTGVPGINVVLKQGIRVPVLLGWENGQPNRPFAALWPSGILGASRDQIERLIIEGLTVELGAAGLDFRDGVLTGQSLDGGTGLPHWMLGNGSATVRAKP
jgi:hypothetical protein